MIFSGLNTFYHLDQRKDLDQRLERTGVVDRRTQRQRSRGEQDQMIRKGKKAFTLLLFPILGFKKELKSFIF